MRKILLFLSFTFALFASSVPEYKVEELVWERGESFLLFLSKNNIPKSVYTKLEASEQELTAEIIAGIKYQILRDQFGEIAQVLIPISEQLQIQIYKDLKNEFAITFTPISVQEESHKINFEIKSSVYKDVVSHTNNHRLASAIIRAYSGTINYKGMKQGDKVAIIYTQNRRLGKIFGTVDIKAAMVQVNKKPFYIFQYLNHEYYNDAGKQLENFEFILPVGKARISSPFNPGRFHPILKKYRAHLGIDYAVVTGTPIHAAGRGKVIFRGVQGGYGNVVKVSHENGYMTLYAHMSRFKNGVNVGSYVRQGQVIGYVGTTGMSTGPHLHFGMYKNGRAFNPATVVRVTKDALKGKKKKEFDKIAREYIMQINEEIERPSSKIIPEVDFENAIELDLGI